MFLYAKGFHVFLLHVKSKFYFKTIPIYNSDLNFFFIFSLIDF